MNCIECCAASLVPKNISLVGEVRGEQYVVNMEGLECPNCGYRTIEGSAMPEYARLLADEYRSRHGLLTSNDIRTRRARLDMSQETFAEYVGVGPASIKRWE